MVDLEALRPLLAEQWTLLTPNRRLAHRIRQAVLDELPVGVTAATPPVYALADWLERLWRHWLAETDMPELVLSAAQEQRLWQQIILEQGAGMSWLRPGAAAQQAALAYRQMILWQADLDSTSVRAELAANPDSAALLNWCDTFRERIREAGWLSAADRDQRMVELVAQGRLALNESVATLAFDDIAPLYQQLLRSASAWQPMSLAGPVASAAVIAAENADDEIRQACRWLREQLQQHDTHQDRRPVALVVPDLAQRRARIERLLAEEWDPGSLAAERRRSPWINISAGMPLAETPLVAAGLRLLALWRGELSRAEALALAQCPLAGRQFGDAADVAWIEALCNLGIDPISDEALRACADRVASRCEEWPVARALQQVAELGRRWQVRRQPASPAQWRARFTVLLQSWGWPARTLDSIEYQQFQHWQDALTEFAALDVVSASMSLHEALSALQQVLQGKIFQPEVEEGGLHVVGLLETAGLQFSAAWICGMGARQWPAAAAAHPLLPRALQRRLRMPHSDAARELAFSEQISRSLLGLAPVLRISYAREQDGVEQDVSALFEHLEILPSATASPGLLQQWIDHSSVTLESLMPGLAPSLTEEEQPRGGSRLLQSQSQCPFRAFAEHRLGALPLGNPSLGPTGLERGRLLHRALELLWRGMHNSEALARFRPDQRRARVVEVVSQAVDDWLLERGWQQRQRLRQLEQARLEALLEEWLETVELRRPFFTVVALEQSRTARFGPLTLQLRADRIDQLEDGRYLILDYKGSRTRTEDWLGDRPDDPQLPLYAMLAELEQPDSVAGIAFAELHAESCQLRGLGACVPLARLEAEQWSTQKRTWRRVLEYLAEDFIAGHAEVNPSQPPGTCRHCELLSACRYHHQSTADIPTPETVDARVRKSQ